MSTDDLHNLPLVEKLRLVEELWDDISTSKEPFPMHEWQETEARRRASDFDANPELGMTREELWKRVENSDG